MEIIDEKGEINLSMLMEKTKNSYGLVKWGCKYAKKNAHIVQTYSPTLAKACVWCNRIDGNGVGFEVNSKHL